jgi:hypothetical protein
VTPSRTLVVVVAFVLAIVPVGCGGQSAKDEAQHDWELRVGPAWTDYEEAFDRGWTVGCEEAADAARHDDRDRYDEAFYGTGAGCGHGSTPGFEIPDVPPDDAETKGYGTRTA